MKNKAPTASWITASSRVEFHRAIRAERMLGVRTFWGFSAESWLVYPFNWCCRMNNMIQVVMVSWMGLQWWLAQKVEATTVSMVAHTNLAPTAGPVDGSCLEL